MNGVYMEIALSFMIKFIVETHCNEVLVQLCIEQDFMLLEMPAVLNVSILHVIAVFNLPIIPGSGLSNNFWMVA